ncbi:hypothetical protein T05_266 [Trichinella murrelli]|uniref:Uncharacterized protein n=1 Tax=Trichinella murrelli TaxID=144512 RepID=A0A0V0TKS9_9BILA|nr:hypothetical protein T05_266 [Trichinella murrelli]
MDKLNKTEKANTYTVLKNYYTLQENDELLEAVGRKLSRLTSYDAQKQLDHCSKRGEPVTMQVSTKKKYESLQQLLYPSTAIIH